MRKQYDREDIKEPTETHFGPEEDKKVTQHYVNRKREMQNMLNSELTNQISQHESGVKRKLAREKLQDAVNMGAVNNKLHNEKLEMVSAKK